MEIRSILDAIEFTLEGNGEALSSDWISIQMEEMRLWRASEHDVQAELERDVRKHGDKSRFVSSTEDEWELRSWTND